MFYSDGLDFKCRMCSYCCSSEPGYVFLSEKDIERMCKFLSLDRETFLKTYTRLVDYGTHYLVSLTERKNYDCEFLSPEGCTVYDANNKVDFTSFDEILFSENKTFNEVFDRYGKREV